MANRRCPKCGEEYSNTYRACPFCEEEDAIKQYHMHIKMIDDDCVNAVLRRIIQDEEYHVMLLQALVREG